MICSLDSCQEVAPLIQMGGLDIKEWTETVR